MKRTIALSLCLAATAAAAGSTSHPSFWRYAHPQAKILAGVEWHRLATAPLASQLKQQFEKEMGGLSLANLPKMPALDFLSGIERIFVSSPGESKRVAGRKRNPQFVAALQGRFDLAQVRQAIARDGARATLYKGVVLLVPAGPAGDQCIGLVSPQVLLFGDRVGVQSALDNHGSALPPSPEQARLYARAAELADGNDLWLAGAISPADLAADVAPEARILADVQSFEAGLSLQSGLGLQVNLNTKTEEGARAIGTAIQGMLGLFAMQAQNDPQTAEFLKKLKIASGPSRVSLALHVDQTEMEKNLGAWFTKAYATGPGPVSLRPKVTGEPPAPVESAAVHPPEPPKPAVIRIYGAQGGTREIPLEARPKQ
jgi:hypothetical protein